jgi:hypothetical protein
MPALLECSVFFSELAGSHHQRRNRDSFAAPTLEKPQETVLGLQPKRVLHPPSRAASTFPYGMGNGAANIAH